MHKLLASACVVASASAAFAAPAFYSTLGGASALQPNNNKRIESRFRVDTNNWDSRLEFDSFPNVGDVTGNVGPAGNKSYFENHNFDFSLLYTQATGDITWTITGRDGSTTVLNQLAQNVASVGFVNTIHVFTTGSRGSVSISNLMFLGHSMNVNAWPDLNTAPSPAVTFKETYLFFGNSFNLLAADFELKGNIAFGVFTNNNPSEGAKITVKLRDANIPAPAPASASLLAVVGLAASRRRR